MELFKKPKEMVWPIMETPEYIISIGCLRPAENTFRLAVQELIKWIVEDYGFSKIEAYFYLFIFWKKPKLF